MKSEAYRDLRALLRRASRAASRQYRARLAEFDLSASQASALLFLDAHGGSTLRDLAEALGVDLATASALVDKLMSQELVRRETDPDDRRRARLLLSGKAVALLQPLADATRESNDMLVRALGKRRSEELATVLSDLLEAMGEPVVAKRDKEAV